MCARARPQVRHIHKDADLNTAKLLMSEFQVSALLVDTRTSVPGFVTKRDFLKVSFSKTLKKARVQDVMTTPVRAGSAAVRRWGRPPARQVAGRPALRQRLRQQQRLRAQQPRPPCFAGAQVISVPAGTTLRDAVRFIALKGIRRVLVYDAAKEDPLNPLAAYTVRWASARACLSRAAHARRRRLPRPLSPM